MNVIIVISSLLDKSQTGINSILENMSTFDRYRNRYHSAREPSDFDNDTEEELRQVESEEEEPTGESDNSDAGSVLGRASLHSQHSMTENRYRKRTG